MSILIKGLEMPQNGAVHIVITSSGYVESTDGTPLPDVEAIELSPHGDLVDFDAIINNIYNVPTVVPSD